MKRASCAWLIAFWLLNVPLHAAAYEAPFVIKGEQLKLQIPDGWSLARQVGTPEGSVVQEYLPAGEDLGSWRKGYLAIQRYRYPSGEAGDGTLKRSNLTAEIALDAWQELASNGCAGTNVRMTPMKKRVDGVNFAVSGGFCDRYGSAAPYGEGAYVAFVEGQDYMFRIQYGWRPDSELQRDSQKPWRIDSQTSRRYVESIKGAILCGASGQARCTQ